MFLLQLTTAAKTFNGNDYRITEYEIIDTKNTSPVRIVIYKLILQYVLGMNLKDGRLVTSLALGHNVHYIEIDQGIGAETCVLDDTFPPDDLNPGRSRNSIGGGQGCLYSLSGAPARPRRGSQHRPPRPPADLLRRPPPGPQHPPPRPPLTSSTAPSAALSTHPHGAPYHPTKLPLRGPQHPPPGVPPPPHQSPPPRLPAPTPTAPH